MSLYMLAYGKDWMAREVCMGFFKILVGFVLGFPFHFLLVSPLSRSLSLSLSLSLSCSYLWIYCSHCSDINPRDRFPPTPNLDSAFNLSKPLFFFTNYKCPRTILRRRHERNKHTDIVAIFSYFCYNSWTNAGYPFPQILQKNKNKSSRTK